jgi:hypothetical protein
MRVVNTAGWVVTTLGVVLWVYGYYVTGVPPLVDWQANTPAWIAEFLPNLEAEIGFALMLAGSIPVYWVMYRQRA